MSIGGFNSASSSLSDVEIVDLDDPAQFCFKPANFPTTIEQTAAEVIEGRVWVCGGYTNFNPTEKCYSYDVINDLWDEEASMTYRR